MASYSDLRALRSEDESIPEDRPILNDQTILSSFNDKLTLLKWLKNLIQKLEDYGISSMSWDNDIEANGRFRLIITYENGEQLNSDYLYIPSISLAEIQNLFL